MIKLSSTIYSTEATNTGGRQGHVKSSDGVIDMDVRMPAPNSPYTNPEQLFAAGYASCFNGAIAAIAKGRNVADSEITAKVTLGKTEEGGYGLAVELTVKLPHLSLEEAQQVADDAHKVCPYSNATRGNIEVSVKAIA